MWIIYITAGVGVRVYGVGVGEVGIGGAGGID